MRLLRPSVFCSPRVLASLRGTSLALVLPAVLAVPAVAQDGGLGVSAPVVAALDSVRILGVSVTGTSSEAMRGVVLQAAGLQTDQRLVLPIDPALSEALRKVNRLAQFSDVRLLEDRRVGDGVFLIIEVTEAPRIAEVVVRGVKDDDKTALQARLPFVRGTRLTQTDFSEAASVARAYFRNQGYPTATAAITRQDVEGGVNVVVTVNKGPRSRVGGVEIEGNTAISDRTIVSRLRKTRPPGWRFWVRDSYRPELFEEDKGRILNLYRSRGYYDARIVSDTARIVMRGGKPRAIVTIRVDEGRQYHVRNVAFEGNTRYNDQQLQRVIGIVKGDVFNLPRIEENLYGNKAQNHLGALYQNEGYLRFNVEPQYNVVGPDSVDLVFDIAEGDTYDFGSVTIAGNTKTKEHVVRRELYTIPGQAFSREAIMESLRRLQQLGYFSPESLNKGPDIRPNDRTREVDMTYSLEEVGSDQLELSGTYAGTVGLILQLGVTFKNFSAQNLFDRSAWRPVPMGDGQEVSVRVQTAGTRYQTYSLSFTEPWLRGRPTPVGFAVSYTRYNLGQTVTAASDTVDNRIAFFSNRVFYNRRLRFPDDKFDLSTGLGYRRYYFTQAQNDLPAGSTNELTANFSLSRNSLDNPLFPRRGALTRLSLDVAPPLPGFEQYHKWGLSTQWNAPLHEKISVGLAGQFGYIGSLTGDPVRFQRFLVGGSPLDNSGGISGQSFIGKDIVYARGYPTQVIGPRRYVASSGANVPVGGRILNKYAAELRWLAVQSAQLQAAPYLFADAVNTWDGFDTYNPASLYRSAGVGVRLFLPILGMVELAYGYNFDRYIPLSGSEKTGASAWGFQFSIGQGFNQ
ncbi:MAG: outer membrane protein assembly factor BamA [Bacteroidetes bacterium]|nr:outer membrane protein assembly factor BamA [Bacteroidota bacterium]